MSQVKSYIHDIVRRARVPMEPTDHVVDWMDQPRRHKVYPGRVRLDLAAGDGPAGRTLEQTLVEGPAEERPFTLDLLGRLLWNSYAVTGRRLAIHRNDDVPAQPTYTRATWSRATAGGGGLYPLEVYWAAGPSAGVLPGLYNYTSAHHGLTRIAVGDVTGRVRDALPPGHEQTDQFLLITVKFWKNAFKYNSFCQHVVQTDVGTLLGSWRLWGAGHGLPVAPAFWFDEPCLDDLLGIDGMAESVFAVVPLPWVRAAGGAQETSAGIFRGPIDNVDAERSRTVESFESVEAIQREMLAITTPPDPVAELPAPRRGVPGAPGVPLPPPTRLDVPVSRALHQRRSSFGRFDASTPLSQADLHGLLRAGVHGARSLDVEGRSPQPLLGQTVFVNHVEDLDPGVYDYDPEDRVLRPTYLGEVGGFCQRNYFLTNYNLEQAAVVHVVRSPVTAVIDALGPRGYRLLNASLGAMSQHVYTAAAALGLGCGAALGFDNVSFAEVMGTASLEGSDDDEWPLLIHMLGHEVRPGAELWARLPAREALTEELR
ncbi:nitroreductase family protein [Modestobacter sp. VKM Ac-2977]|uniref:nitroreductase family protein n=1 Tax=Modestobacter sp. VKM Ac-2977 TaxID=3004131 RepID=UPI0022AAA50A|nr:nitroreductase family protein [Modestobacter sp. VKM Ac-2977]MCZ2819832.1 nitroreductase family protein [Modestobacter sp. VKM Ac-2977]